MIRICLNFDGIFQLRGKIRSFCSLQYTIKIRTTANIRRIKISLFLSHRHFQNYSNKTIISRILKFPLERITAQGKKGYFTIGNFLKRFNIRHKELHFSSSFKLVYIFYSPNQTFRGYSSTVIWLVYWRRWKTYCFLSKYFSTRNSKQRNGRRR